MIYASKGLFGLLWKPAAETGDELVRAWEIVRSKFGAEALTGKVYGRQPTLEGVKEAPGLPKGMWLFELRSEFDQAQPDRV